MLVLQDWTAGRFSGTVPNKAGQAETVVAIAIRGSIGIEVGEGRIATVDAIRGCMLFLARVSRVYWQHMPCIVHLLVDFIQPESIFLISVNSVSI